MQHNNNNNRPVTSAPTHYFNQYSHNILCVWNTD